VFDIILYEGNESIIAGIIIGFIFTLIAGMTLVYLYKRKGNYSFLQNIRDDEL